MKLRILSTARLSFALASPLAALLAAPSAAEVPAYKVDKSFGQNEIKAPPTCVSMDAKDRLHVLLRDGTVMIYDAEGKLSGSFKADMQPVPTTMTVAEGRIYLFGSEPPVETLREFQGKKVKVMEPVGLRCWVYDPAGAKQAEIKLPGVALTTDAHFIGDKLVIADRSRECLVFFALSGNEGNMIRKISECRWCCGIFDFCPGTDANSLVVANLGAFKVQTFQDDKKISEFGARGQKESEFHGCCNPVNVACLADGCIVTVEKSPTRVKVYDKAGQTAKLVSGLGELVAGCRVIPIAVDSKGAFYLASSQKNCIIKCVPGVAAAGATESVAPPAQ